jgi:hypothetical protein
MEYRKHARLLVLLPIFCASALNAAESPRIYRYVDNNGQKAFNSVVPPEFAKNGYTILDQKGRVLKEVPPARTREESAEQTAQREQQREAEEARIARQEQDNILLRVYRTPADIERKRDLSLAEFDTQIAAKTAELEQLDAEIAQFEQQPDSAEVTKLKYERDDVDTELLTLTAKREQAAYGFEEDIERLRYLQRPTKNTAAN